MIGSTTSFPVFGSLGLSGGAALGFSLAESFLVAIPVAIFLGVMFWAPRRMKRWSEDFSKDFSKRTDQHYDRVEASLERIATALEKMQRKEEDDG
ncbi:MAG: hypothetical protein HYY24_02105 [Verrucomicrobia bacterium]|nr:hypothetical protein [Verrucomicrobiota bacterium]